MSELSQSLIDAAGKAIDGHHQAHLGEARAAVAAVLETLAAGQMVMSDEFLRRLAAEVKEGTA